MKIIKVSAMWCPACLIARDIWSQIKEEYPDHEYIDLDYDLDGDEVSKYNVGEILPEVIVLDDDKEIRLIGEKSKKEILKEIGDLL